MHDEPVNRILAAYPQVYLACHVDHRTRASSRAGITAREASFLTHIGSAGTSPAELARHIGIGRSTMSAALARLESLGLVVIEPDGRDARRRIARLTESGQEAIRESSVLDPNRLEALLAELSDEERAQAVRGLELLASAARRYRERGSK